MKKNISTILLASVLTLSLGACANSDEPETSTSDVPGHVHQYDEHGICPVDGAYAGVSENASGWTGSAGSDAAAINKWFWSNMRWLYLNIGASWLYTLTPKLRAGPVINFSIPVGGLISDHTAQGMLISAGIKICR